MKTRSLSRLAMALLLVAAVTSCSDDDDAATDVPAGDAADDDSAGGDDTPAEGEFAAYCGLVEQLDSQDGPPTEDQMNEIKEIRPDEIGEEIDFVADKFIEAEGDIGQVFADPEVEEKFEVIDAFETEHCGFEDDDTGGGEEGEDDDGDTEAAEGAAVVAVTGVDFAFQGLPDTLPAGLTAFEFTNEGESIHELGVFALEDGESAADRIAEVEAAFESDGEIGDLGYAFTPPGGDPRYANVDLEPGTYLIVCFIPGPEGKSHHELGMQQTVTVS